MSGTDFTARSATGAELSGRHWPTQDARAIMALVHGFGEHCGRYADMAAHLNAQQIAVIALDLPGHGRSPGKRGVIRDYDDFRAALAALLSEAKTRHPGLPLILFGHSMGGGIVLDHGFDPDPDVRAILASAPLIELAEAPSTAIRTVAKIIGTLAPNAAMSTPLDGDKISTLPAEQAAYTNDPLNHGQMGFRTARALIETGERIAERATDWTTPLLLFHSQDDQLTRFEASQAFAAQAQNVDFHAFEGVAHEMHNDRSRAQVYDLITGYIHSRLPDDSA